MNTTARTEIHLLWMCKLKEICQHIVVCLLTTSTDNQVFCVFVHFESDCILWFAVARELNALNTSVLVCIRTKSRADSVVECMSEINKYSRYIENIFFFCSSNKHISKRRVQVPIFITGNTTALWISCIVSRMHFDSWLQWITESCFFFLVVY